MKHLKNPAAQFSLAYRLGYQAKRNQEPITNIPPEFLHDSDQRQAFESGWLDAQDALSKQKVQSDKKRWKQKTWWVLLLMAGGVLTGINLISQSEKEHLNVPAPSNIEPPSELGLLSHQARQDLKDLKENYQARILIDQQPLKDSTLQPYQGSLQNPQGIILDSNITKYEDHLIFHLQFVNVAPVELKWIWQQQLIQSESFQQSKIKSELAMTSSRQGEWRIEVWHNNQPIYRYKFYYGQPN
jgi:hypothetical protein